MENKKFQVFQCQNFAIKIKIVWKFTFNFLSHPFKYAMLEKFLIFSRRKYVGGNFVG